MSQKADSFGIFYTIRKCIVVEQSASGALTHMSKLHLNTHECVVSCRASADRYDVAPAGVRQRPAGHATCSPVTGGTTGRAAMSCSRRGKYDPGMTPATSKCL